MSAFTNRLTSEIWEIQRVINRKWEYVAKLRAELQDIALVAYEERQTASTDRLQELEEAQWAKQDWVNYQLREIDRQMVRRGELQERLDRANRLLGVDSEFASLIDDLNRDADGAWR